MVDETFSQVVVRDADTHDVIKQTIISSMDSLVVTQNNASAGDSGIITLSPTADITIYADTVTIRGPITARGKDVKIIARVLKSELEAAIIVDGKDGKTADALPVPKQATPQQMAGGVVHCCTANTPPTPGMTWALPATPGGNGDTGKKAGIVRVSCSQTVGGDKPFALKLSANGGRGGNGGKGQDGADGGKGGNGDDACSCGGILWFEEAQSGARGGDGVPGGRGGDAGHGGDGHEATFLCGQAVPKGVTLTAKAGPDGTPGREGKGGQGGPGGDGGKGLTAATVSVFYMSGGNRGPTGSGASDGAPGGVAGTPPKDGSARAEKVGADQLVPANHETRAWLTMILARAEYDFLAAGDDLESDHLKQATLRYKWLAELSEAHIKASTAIDSGVHNVFQTATNRIKSIGAGLNYFGQSASFVPMGSMDYWTTQTTQALKALQTFEPLYQAYVDLDKDQTARLAGLKQSVSDSTARVFDLQKELTGLFPKLQPHVDTIDSLDRDIAAQSNDVMTSFSDLQAAVQTAFGLSWKDAFSAIGSLAFLQGSDLNKRALVAGKALELGDEAFTDIVADDGTKINKNLMVSKLLTEGQDFSTLPEGFSMVAHQISLGDPNGVKLLHEKQDIDTLLDKIASWDQAQEVRAALDEYVSKVSARNQAVLDYNSVVRRLLQIETDIHTEQRHVEELQGAQGEIDPDLTHAVNYMSFVYKSICAAFVRNLFMCVRSAAFWSLDRSLSLQAVTGSPVDPHQMNSATAQGWQTRATKLLSDAHETLGGAPQKLDNIVYRLDQKNAGEFWNEFKLRKRHVLNFSIPAASKEMSVKQSPFAGWADVRTLKVAVRLNGAKYQTDGTGADTIHVGLKHLGHETLATTSGELVSVAHAPRMIGFEYQVDSATGVMTLNTKGNNLESGEGDYAPIGPFANWTLTIDPKLNSGLNLKALTSIDLIFSGQAREFD